MAEAGFAESLTKEVGGIPVWVIGAGVGGVIAVGAYFKNRNSGGVQTVYSPDDLQPEDELPGNDDYGLPEGPLGDWLRENPGWPSYPTGGTVRGLPGPITNAQWSRFAQDELLAKGSDPGLVTGALSKYLTGAGLTEAEKAVVRLALQLFGALPEGPLEIKSVTTPVNPSPTFGAPSNLHTVANGRLSIRMAWTGVPGALAYTIVRGPSAQAATRSVPLLTSYQWYGLKPNTVYTFSVYARGPGGASTKSNVISTRTAP
jgi:hypothetical protein